MSVTPAHRPSRPFVRRDPQQAEQGFFAFAVAFFVFHQAWVVLSAPTSEAVVSVATPFAVVGAAVAVIRGFGTPRTPALAAIAAATLYVHGREAHVAANSIQREIDAPIVTFWDERFGHVVGVLGWLGLLAAFCLAERATRPAQASSPVLLAFAAVLFGWTAFTATVEGETWWLLPIATPLFAIWAIRAPAPRPLLRTTAGSLVLGVLLVAGWALWHGAVPELTAL